MAELLKKRYMWIIAKKRPPRKTGGLGGIFELKPFAVIDDSRSIGPYAFV
jgi:hypothetical protein